MKSYCVSEILTDETVDGDVRGKRFAPTSSPLDFRPVTLDVMPDIRRILCMSPSLTCDYSIGGIYMWVNYFNYKYCIYHDTLFIMGVEENCLDRPAFSCPVGEMPMPEAIGLVEAYCRDHGLDLLFSAVPADRLSCFLAYNPGCKVEELSDWSDYVYEIGNFASLSGKKLAKKRNHVNRFRSDYPDAHLDTFTVGDVDSIKEALSVWSDAENDDVESLTKGEELRQVVDVLDNFDFYGFDGAILRSGGADDRIVAFTLGEKIGETFFVHIEKMDHSVSGAGETVAHLFALDMFEKYPGLRFLNREEDCGDPGLRYAKQSWQPTMLLRKYNVVC